MTLLPLLLALAPAPFVGDGDPWEVDAQRGTSTRLEFTATEGTWISVDVSPDGTQLAFDLLGHVYRMPVAGGAATPLTSGRSWNSTPRWSPDGSELLFTSDRGGSEDLWVLELESGELTNLTNQPLPVFLGNWSADGQHVVGTSLDMRVRFPVHRYNRFGTRQELIGADGRNPLGPFVPHPTDAALFFEHQDGRYPADGPRIKRYDLETGELETIVQRPGGGSAPALSPDGTQLAYVHRDDKRNLLVVRDLETRAERIVAVDLDRGRFESTHFYGAHPAIDWHPDAARVFYSAGGKLHAVDVETREVTEVPFEAPVSRLVEETLRFPVPVPDAEFRTRSHRWATRTERGVVFESLGDLWILADTARRPLVESSDHLTSPLVDEAGGRIFCATWNDAELGGLAVLPLTGGPLERLPVRPSQYGSLALSPDGRQLAYLRGDGALAEGLRLEDQKGFELCLLDLATGGESPVTEITWTGNRYGKRPPSVRFAPDGARLYFTEYEGDALVLKRVRLDGESEKALVRFPHATRAVLSPDLSWIVFKEYHRTFVTPFEWAGKLRDVSSTDDAGFAKRVSEEWDGDFFEWSADGTELSWTRGRSFCEESLADVLSGTGTTGRTDLSRDLPVAHPSGAVAFTGVTVFTMDAEDRVLENVTLLVDDSRVAAVGADVEIPAGARVVDATGQFVMPGMFDAHGHYGSNISPLNVVEQRPYGLQANLAYGVTTMMDVYGTTQKDFWLGDMLRAGRISGPRLFSVGDPIFVTKYRTKMHRPITSLDDALEHARFNQDHGATALKDYSNHTRAARQQLAEACRRLGLNLVTESFGTPAMNSTQLIDGFTGLEHTLGLTPIYDDVRRLFGATDAGITATLIVLYGGPAGEQYFHARERLWEDEKLLHFYRADQLLRLRRPKHHFDDDWYHPEMVGELRRLADAGVLLTMGAHGQMMGLGAHWEMELFVQGGVAPLEAIRIATINGFRHHGLDAELGSIEPGKYADFVLLADDPREDIRNTRSIISVVKNGVLYSGADASRAHPEPLPYEPLYFQDAE